MSGEMNIRVLLRTMHPELSDTDFVFSSLKGSANDFSDLNPFAIVSEPEGLTLVLEKSLADQQNFAYENVYKRITLRVHSSLEAVGLTAAISGKLASAGISANIIAGFYHDHIFVNAVQAKAAQQALLCLSSNGE